MNPNVFPQAWRRGVYEAIVGRRDMRHFKPDPVPRDTLARILSAAHHAGSVGFSQPWNFLVVEDMVVRKKLHAHVDHERRRAMEAFEGKRKEMYGKIKLEAILDAPLNVCVTCDPTRFGPAIIGRNTMPETTAYSTCGAIQNLWLAARAEGVGVGWVSILEPDVLRGILKIPEPVIPVAYLCMGFVDEFPVAPTFETLGWLPRLPLEELVYSDTWGQGPEKSLMEALREVPNLSEVAPDESETEQ